MRTSAKQYPQSNSSTDVDTSFELNDTLYARASIAPSDMEEVYLWLGANVMLAYPVVEAEEMLQEKLSAAEKSLANCEEDLEFLREQVTVSSTPRWQFSSVADMWLNRHWRLLRRECIIGMWCSDGRRRLKGRAMTRRMEMRRRRSPMVSSALDLLIYFIFLALVYIRCAGR